MSLEQEYKDYHNNGWNSLVKLIIIMLLAVWFYSCTIIIPVHKAPTFTPTTSYGHLDYGFEPDTIRNPEQIRIIKKYLDSLGIKY